MNANLEPLHQIIAARVIQAIGGGGAVPVSLAIAAALVSSSTTGAWPWALWPERRKLEAC